MADFLKRVNVLLVFIVLFSFHGFMYSSFGNSNWLGLTIVATVVDTGILLVLRSILVRGRKQRGN